MSLPDRVMSDLTQAMRERRPGDVSALRQLRAAIQYFQVARTDSKHPLFGQPITEDDYSGLLQKEIRQRQDSIEQFERAGRNDLVEIERAEIEVLGRYLPAQLSREDIVAAVDQIVVEAGRDFRKVMPVAAKRLKGLADGRLVNEVVRERTS